MVYELSALPVSATSTLRSDWPGGILYSILYPVMESSLGSSQVSVTEVVVDVAWRPVGAAGGGGAATLIVLTCWTAALPELSVTSYCMVWIPVAEVSTVPVTATFAVMLPS